jgi:hypothetical protein
VSPQQAADREISTFCAGQRRSGRPVGPLNVGGRLIANNAQ